MERRKSNDNKNDLDAHCIDPNGYRLFFANRTVTSPTGGRLDVDISSPIAGKPAVENITWANTNNMIEGTYQFLVHCFSDRGGSDGFGGGNRSRRNHPSNFSYNKPIKNKDFIHVANVTYSHANGFTVTSVIPSTASSREIWGLQTQQFVPVSMIMKSPNCWNGEAIGNEIYILPKRMRK